MESSYYKAGTIKVAWYDKSNSDVMMSEMFDNIEEAVQFGKSKGNFMLMKLTDQTGDYYKWEVLPYGDYSKYNYGMAITNNPYAMALIFLFLVVGTFTTFKFLFNWK